MPIRKPPVVVKVSRLGGITLTAEIRRAAGVHAGDALTVSVDGRRIVLQPTGLVPSERYTDERVREFAAGATLSGGEIAQAKRKWGV